VSTFDIYMLYSVLDNNTVLTYSYALLIFM
jgi:hypothetical protein